MRLARHIVRYVLAGALLLLSPLAALSGATQTHSRFSGIYQSDLPEGNKPGPSMSVSLGKDGTATLTQDFGKGAVTSFGHWNDAGSQVTITFDATDGKPAPAPMAFQPGHDGLQAVTWDHAAWGKLTPPPMKKESSNWHNKSGHGFKIW